MENPEKISIEVVLIVNANISEFRELELAINHFNRCSLSFSNKELEGIIIGHRRQNLVMSSSEIKVLIDNITSNVKQHQLLNIINTLKMLITQGYPLDIPLIIHRLNALYYLVEDLPYKDTITKLINDFKAYDE